MTAEEWVLAASAFFAGLAAGFLGGLCVIIRPIQAAMQGREFRSFMEEAGEVGRRQTGRGVSAAVSDHSTAP